MRKPLLALAALVLSVCGMGVANAACPYTGNTSGTDSAAILNGINDICSNTGTSGTGSNVQASPGSDASKAVAVQGVTGGKAVTVSLPTGASTATNQTAVQAPVAPATATATKAVLGGCQYNSAGVTATDGQQMSVQCGSKGGLLVNGNVASAASDVGNPIKTGSVYNSAVPTVTTGQRVDSQADAHGSAKVISADTAGNAIDPTLPVQTYENDSFAHVAAGTTTTVIKSGSGTLKRISINTKGASSNTLTLYDNTAGSGTVIAIIDGTSDRDHTFDLAFGTGLTAVSATGTGADFTCVYR